MISYVDNKFTSKIEQIYSIDDGYFYCVKIPDELVKSLSWEYNTSVVVDVKLGERNNVLVIQKK